MKKLLNVSRSSNLSTRKNAGFTLIEILVVIGIIALLATIVIVAINPARQFAQARNTQRTSHINTILNAIGQNIADNKGVFTCGTVTLTAGTASTSIDNGTGGSGKDLSCLTPTYTPSLPADPISAAAPATGYFISVNSIGRVLICAPSAVESSIPGSAALCAER